jgi:hypothetical protein
MRGHIPMAIAIVLLVVDLVARFPLAAHSQSTPFARFAGGWPTHGGGLSIGPRGNGYYQLRTYVNCSTTILTDCDRSKGNYIYPGGYGAFRLIRVSGNTAFGTIVNSSTSWEINTRIAFTLTSKDVLIATGASDLLNRRSFCGPHAPAGACGA